ncbi:hypothetical protein AOLI_G00325890 [Acnodon oligacanthus]
MEPRVKSVGQFRPLVDILLGCEQQQHPVTSLLSKEELRWPTTQNAACTMSSSLVVCEVDPSLKEKLKKFRFRKETTNAAILMKIDMEKQLVILEEEYEDISLDDLREELPERQPRYPYHFDKFII